MCGARWGAALNWGDDVQQDCHYFGIFWSKAHCFLTSLLVKALDFSSFFIQEQLVQLESTVFLIGHLSYMVSLVVKCRHMPRKDGALIVMSGASASQLLPIPHRQQCHKHAVPLVQLLCATSACRVWMEGKVCWISAVCCPQIPCWIRASVGNILVMEVRVGKDAPQA